MSLDESIQIVRMIARSLAAKRLLCVFADKIIDFLPILTGMNVSSLVLYVAYPGDDIKKSNKHSPIAVLRFCHITFLQQQQQQPLQHTKPSKESHFNHNETYEEKQHTQ